MSIRRGIAPLALTALAACGSRPEKAPNEVAVRICQQRIAAEVEAASTTDEKAAALISAISDAVQAKLHPIHPEDSGLPGPYYPDYKAALVREYEKQSSEVQRKVDEYFENISTSPVCLTDVENVAEALKNQEAVFVVLADIQAVMKHKEKAR